MFLKLKINLNCSVKNSIISACVNLLALISVFINTYIKGLLKYCYSIIAIVLMWSMFFNTKILSIEASNKDEISVKYFLILVEEKLDLDSKKPIETALSSGLIKDGEFSNYGDMLTNEGAAIIANRADIIKYGDKSEDKNKVDRARKNGRIYETLDLKADSIDEVYGTFVKGILIGESGGMFTQWRKLYPNKNISRKDAITVVKNIEDVKKRKKMSPDGQLIRTTNLPKNYKRFDYILKAFPNSFYEKKFEFEHTKYPIKPREFVEYAYPNRMKYKKYVNSEIGVGTVKQQREMLDEYLDEWCHQVEKNLYYRFNVDYRTIDKQWKNELRSTYKIIGDPDYDKDITINIEKYIKKVKKDKIIIELDTFAVEPSTLYFDDLGNKLRCYVKYRLVNTSLKNYTAEDIFYADMAYMKNLEKGKWLERYFDVEISPASNNSYGEGYYVSWYDYLLEWDDSVVKK